MRRRPKSSAPVSAESAAPALLQTAVRGVAQRKALQAALLLIATLFVAGLLRTEIVAAARGPRLVDGTSLERQARTGAGFDDLFVLDREFSVEAGFDWVETKEVNGSKTEHKAHTFRLVMLPGGAVLAAVPVGQTRVGVGELRPLPAGLVGPMRNALEKHSVSTPLIPALLDTTGHPRQRNAVIAAALLAAGLVLVETLARQLRRMIRPESDPAIVRLHPDVVTRQSYLASLNHRIACGDASPGKDTPVALTDDALIIRTKGVVDTVPFESIVWAYTKVRNHKRFGSGSRRPQAELTLLCRDHRSVAVPCDSEGIAPLVQQLTERAPWMSVGYRDGLEAVWLNERSKLFAIADERRIAHRALEGELVSEAPTVPIPSFEASNGRFRWQRGNGPIGRGVARVIGTPKRALTSGASSLLILALPAYSVVAPEPRAVSPTWSSEMLPLVRFVESERGAKFREVVPIDMLEPELFDRLSGNDGGGWKPTCDSDPLCVNDRGEPLDLRRTAFEDLGVEPSESTSARSATTSIGYYSPKEQRLVVRGTTLTSGLRAVLVHELVHAWQDQHLDLAKNDSRIASSEEALAWRSLVEGDALRVETRFVGSLVASEQKKAELENSAPPEQLRGFDRIRMASGLFPYLAGPRYVEGLYERGGVQAIDAAIRRRPLVLREVVQRKRYAGIEPLKIATSPGERVLYEEHMDPVAYALLLAEFDASVSLQSLLETWKGATLQVVTFQGRRCVRVAVPRGSVALPSVPDPSELLPIIADPNVASVGRCPLATDATSSARNGAPELVLRDLYRLGFVGRLALEDDVTVEEADCALKRLVDADLRQLTVTRAVEQGAISACRSFGTSSGTPSAGLPASTVPASTVAPIVATTPPSSAPLPVPDSLPASADEPEPIGFAESF